MTNLGLRSDKNWVFRKENCIRTVVQANMPGRRMLMDAVCVTTVYEWHAGGSDQITKHTADEAAGNRHVPGLFTLLTEGQPDAD